MSAVLCETAYAKINLALHVRRRRPDGYHELETLFAFAEEGDFLTVAPSDGLSLVLTGPFGAAIPSGPENLVLRAALALRQAFSVMDGAQITLDKRLPVAAGIGGGSADAAAVLRLLCRFWSLDPQDNRVAQCAGALGADVPACLRSTALWGDGIGDQLSGLPLGGLASAPLLLVNPLIPCLTGPVFQGWDGRDRGPLGRGDTLSIAQAGRNDLEPPAIALVPEIAGILGVLKDLPNVLLARMSGSGATCFALFESTQARDGAARLFPNFWCLPTRLRVE